MPLLAPLPATPFELAEWKQATVQFNYHIAVDRMFYSVPYQYIKNKVDVRITDTTVEIFYNHNRIASHRRLYGRSGQYSTVTEHMPQEHQKYLEWNGDRFRKWADSIGINTSKVVDAILTSGRIEQQSYRSCMGLLKLAEKYSPEKLEQVCAKALSYSGKPSYKSIKNLLAAMKEVPFEDRFGMLVDVEYSNRKNNRLKRLIRQAEFEQPDASIAAIDYHSGRKLNKALINRLATCEYITEYRNIFITGATGSGKTYMACAFGMEACKHYYSVRYVRLPDLLLDLQAARDNGTFSTVLKKYTKPIVLIIDEWLLLKLTEAEARNLFELIHKRRRKSSTIFCFQFRESEWYQQICDGESTLADAIMDRISYDSYKIDIESVDPSKDLSMREVYGLNPAMEK